MTSALLVAVALIVGLVAGALLMRRGAASHNAESIALRAELQHLVERLAGDSTMLTGRLEGIEGRMTQTQTSSSDLARHIFDALGDVRRATSTVAEQAREFSTLQDLLRAPKARGGLGEAMLEELLRQVLPPAAFATQYRFSTGAVVDAVVKAGGKLVCIDSKFPLSNYRRMCEARDDAERAEAERAFATDVERHIRDISSRYIVPDEQTLEFAVMYVPAEGVYGEILRLSHRRRPLFETAIETRVVPMSPLTMYAYLQTVLFGLKGLKIEKNAEAILAFTGTLQRDFERFAGEYDTLGRHLQNARSKYDDGARRLDRLGSKLERVVDLAEDSGPGDDERPSLNVVGD